MQVIINVTLIRIVQIGLLLNLYIFSRPVFTVMPKQGKTGWHNCGIQVGDSDIILEYNMEIVQ